MAFWENEENTDQILTSIIQIQKEHTKIMEIVEQKL
jgi:hypothetical protein